MSNKTIRREREVARIQEDILWAFARASVKKGAAQVTMQDIALEAGCTPPTLYAYFKSKDEIREALRELLSKQLLATFQAQVPAGLTFSQRLELLLQRQFDLVAQHREAVIFFMSARMPSDAEKDQQGFALMLEAMTQWLRTAAKGVKLRVSHKDAASALLGAGQMFFMRWMLEGAREPFNQYMKAMSDIFLHGVLTGPHAGERQKP